MGALALGALASSALALAGCSSPLADMPSLATPADAPDKPKEAGGYLPVNELPPDRDQTVITPDQRAKIEAELIAARDRQASSQAPSSAAQNPAAK